MARPNMNKDLRWSICPVCGAVEGDSCTRASTGGTMPRKIMHTERNRYLNPAWVKDLTTEWN